MKKEIIRPIDVGSILLFIIGVVFPASLIYSIFSIVTNGVIATWIICAIFSAIMTYFISVNAFRIVFMSKFVFYDDYVEITYFDPYIKHITNNFYRMIPPQRTKVYYGNIEKFGSFEGSQIRKDGRDDNNRICVLVSAGGVPVPFKLPKSFDNSRNYFVINCADESAVMIDGKLYSVSQVKKVLHNIELYSGKKATGGYPNVPNMIGLIIILGIVAVAGVPIGLISLECKLNPTHSFAENPPARMVYFLCCMFLIISVLLNLLITKKAENDEDLAQKMKTKKRIFAVSIILFVVAVFAFIITVLQ